MDAADKELIVAVAHQDFELRRCWDEHQRLEHGIERLNSKLYLSAEEELERKEMQKRKLLGKDRLMQMLERYRGEDELSRSA